MLALRRLIGDRSLGRWTLGNASGEPFRRRARKQPPGQGLTLDRIVERMHAFYSGGATVVGMGLTGAAFAWGYEEGHRLRLGPIGAATEGVLRIVDWAPWILVLAAAWPGMPIAMAHVGIARNRHSPSSRSDLPPIDLECD